MPCRAYDLEGEASLSRGSRPIIRCSAHPQIGSFVEPWTSGCLGRRRGLVRSSVSVRLPPIAARRVNMPAHQQTSGRQGMKDRLLGLHGASRMCIEESARLHSTELGRILQLDADIDM